MNALFWHARKWTVRSRADRLRHLSNLINWRSYAAARISARSINVFSSTGDSSGNAAYAPKLGGGSAEPERPMSSWRPPKRRHHPHRFPLSAAVPLSDIEANRWPHNVYTDKSSGMYTRGPPIGIGLSTSGRCQPEKKTEREAENASNGVELDLPKTVRGASLRRHL